MASFGSETRTATAYIYRTDAHGDETEIELDVTGVYNWDETGADVTDIEFDGDFGDNIKASLTDAEWDYIADCLAEA